MRPVLQATYRREDGLPILDGSGSDRSQGFHSEPVGVMKHIFRQSHAELVHQHCALVVRGESNTISENTQRNKIDFQWCPLRSRRNVDVCGQCLKVCVTAVELARCKAMGPVISTVRATWTIRKQRCRKVRSVIDIRQKSFHQTVIEECNPRSGAKSVFHLPDTRRDECNVRSVSEH